MRTKRWYKPMLVMIALFAVTQMAQAQEKSAASTRASCIVRISSPRNVFPLNENVMNSLIASSPVLGEPARAVLGLESASIADIGALNFMMLDQDQTDEQTVLLGELSLELNEGVPPRAVQLLQALCESMRSALTRVGMMEVKRWQDREKTIESEIGKLEAESAAIFETQRKLYAQAERDDLDRGAIVTLVRKYESQREDLRLRMAGMQARQQALTEQIAKIAKQVEESTSNKTIIDGLQRVVELRQKALDRLQMLQQQGQVNDEEVNHAEIEVIQAQTALAQKQEQVREQSGGGLMGGMNQQLRELNIAYEEIMAELGIVEGRLADMREKRLVELAERYNNEVDIPKSMIERMVMDLKQEQHRLKQQLRIVIMPDLQVIGG